MLIYLDTCHIQNIIHSADKDKFLDGTYELVYSWINLSELLEQTDQKKILLISDFLSSIQIKYLRDIHQLLRQDINKYIGNKTPRSPFSKNIRDSILGIKDLELYRHLGDCNIKDVINLYLEPTNNLKQVSRKIRKAHIKVWSDNNKDYRKKMSDLEYWGKVKEEFRTKLLLECSSIGIKVGKYAKELSEINPLDAPSFSIPFYVQYMKHANTGKSWTCSDIMDIIHCEAIPYVDYFVTDKGNADDANAAAKKVEFEGCKIIKNLAEIL